MSTSKQAKEVPPSLWRQLEEITHIVRRWIAGGDNCDVCYGGDQPNGDHDDDDRTKMSMRNQNTQN